MKPVEVVIGLDQGSGSSRALAVDSQGAVVARAQFPIKTYYPAAGFVEHDPADIARTQERALDAVLSRIPRATKVVGLGLASQRTTVVLWDAVTGKALCRAPSWQDARAAQAAAPRQDRQAWAHENTGLYLTPYYSAPKIRWLLDHVPAAREAASSGRLRVGPVASYLLWRLTKGEVFAADPSLAQRTMLYNIRSGSWDDALLDLFSVPKEALPSIAASGGELAVIKRGGRRIPVLAMLGDQQAAAMGLGAASPGASVLNYGSGAFFLLHTGRQQRRVPGLLTSVAWRRDGEPCEFFQEGTVHAAGTSFHWLRKNLKLLGSSAKVDALCRRSEQRLYALQAIGGLGAPRWDYLTFTTYMGFSSQTRPEDIVRAVTEGIAYLIADIVIALRAAGLKVGGIKASGGLSGVDYLLQFQADLLRSPIARIREREATAMGAAALAAEEAGVPWAGLLCRSPADREFRPKMGAGDARRLLEGWKIFVDAQAKLSRDLRLLGALP